MAALTRHGPLALLTRRSYPNHSFTAITRAVDTRNGSTKAVKKMDPRLRATEQSLSAKGFLRPYRPYEPMENVTSRIDKICEARGISNSDETKLEDHTTRFKVLVDCEKEFKHSVPNSLLYSMKTIGDIKQFYLTKVDTVTPLQALRRMELPKNLHVRYEYHRFHPGKICLKCFPFPVSETDTMFGGKTAFPMSSTLVTGLKYKKKYPGHRQEDPYLLKGKNVRFHSALSCWDAPNRRHSASDLSPAFSTLILTAAPSYVIIQRTVKLKM